MVNKKGITYYRLISNYENDYTKECSLTGAEIDGNFLFLRGYDIKGVLFDKNTNTLSLERVNGELIKLDGFDLELGLNFDGSYYDEETNDLHLVINGHETVIKAVQIPYLTTVYSDDTINGDGTLANPLKLSGTLMTGFYQPSFALVDLTVEGAEMPKDVEIGDTYITKEYISPYGLLYNFEGVKAIMDYLKEEKNGWRVPTTEEYGNMLNWLEECEDRGHNNEKLAKYPIGKRAGLGIKAKRTSNKVYDNPWDIVEDDMEISNIYGFSALPAGYISNIKTKTHNGFGEEAVFWTSSVHGDMTNAYARKLRIYDNGVTNDIQAFYNFHSVRLVKDIKYPVSDVEVINGVPYKTEFIPYIDDEGNKGTLAWTKYNVTFNNLIEEGKALPIENDKVFNEVHWFINAWTGNGWEKRELLDNSVVILKDGPDGSNDEEWVLLNNEWVKRTDIYTEIIEGNITDKFYEALYKEKEERIKADELLQKNIDAEEEERKNADALLQHHLDAEIENRIKEDEKIREEIKAEADARKDADDILQDNIDAEEAERKESDAKLQENIEKEAAIRKEEDDKLRDAIKAESDERKEDVKELYDKIASEVEKLEKADSELDKKIKAEAEIRKSEDDKLDEKIKDEAELRKAEDDKLYAAIKKEANDRDDADDKIMAELVKEAKIRKENDEKLQSNIDEEAKLRDDADKALQANIDEEAKLRELNDNILLSKIEQETELREEGDRELEKNKVAIKDFNVTYVPEDKKIYFDISESKNDQKFIRTDDFIKDSFLEDVKVVMYTPEGFTEPKPQIHFTWKLADGTTKETDIEVIDLLGNVFKIDPNSREFITLDDYTFTIHIGTEDDLTRGGLATYRQVHELFEEMMKLKHNIDDHKVNAVKDVVLVDNWVKIEFADGTMSKGFEAKSINANVDVTELQKEIESLKSEITELKNIVNELEANPRGITDIKSSDGDISAVKDENGVVTLTLNGISSI